MTDPRHDAYRADIQRYGGHARSPRRALPAIAGLFLLAWLAATTPWRWVSFAGAITMLGLWFYLPYYLVKWWLREKMVSHLREAERLGVTTWYRPTPETWGGIYIVILIAILWLGIEIHWLMT